MTILAFVYVPLNLATSIFGMNIQQLNQSGQQIRVFLITALVALLLTFFIWLCIPHITGTVQWREQLQVCCEKDQSWPKRGKNYHFIVRVAILYMLLRRGYGRWTWISGAWIRILTNERAGVYHDFELDDFRPVKELCEEGTSACDYVCNYIQWGNLFFRPDFFTRSRKTSAPD